MTNFTITPKAAKFMRTLVMTDGGSEAGFRLAITPGDCSGLSADISVKQEPEAGDVVVSQDGVKLFLPVQSRVLLEGLTIDFVDTPTKTGLVFVDPFAAKTGCGAR